MKKAILLSLLTILSFLVDTKHSFADAWLQEKDHGLIINSVYLQQFDATNPHTGGTYQDQRITSLQYGIYGEYGLLKTLTVGLKAFAISNSYIQGNALLEKPTSQSVGLDFIEIFGRQKLFTNKSIAVSLVGFLQFPGLYDPNKAPQEFGPRVYQSGGKIEFGYNFGGDNENLQIYNANSNFFTASMGLRQLNGADYNLATFEATYGYFLDDSMLLLTRFQKYAYIFHDAAPVMYDGSKIKFDSLDIIGNPGLAKAMLSLAIRLEKYTILELGMYTGITSSLIHTDIKIDSMNGLFVSLWYQF